MMKRLVAIPCLLLFTCAAHAADNNALMELLKALYENGTINKETYELVVQVAEQETRTKEQKIQQVVQTESQRSAEEVVKREISQVTKPGKKAGPTVRVGGRIQIDAATYNEDISRHNDGTEIRRARLFASGELSENWKYKLQYDFTSTGISGIQDAFLDYKGFESFDLRLGHFKEPFSLQNMTSSKYISFMERGMPHVFAEGRNIGLQLHNGGDNWNLYGGVFGDGRDGASSDNDEGMGFSGRLTYVPYQDDNSVVHLGASASHRATGSVDTLRFRERPESHVTNTYLVDTGTFDADSFSRYVAEAAWVYGPFNLQGEYYHTTVEREISANPDLDFGGFYVEGGWFITGESMNYKKSGEFSRIQPKTEVGKGGFGAWQLATRFSNLDLTDEDITGGEIDSFTVGLNWFATSNIRFTANYVNVLNVDDGPADGDEPDLFQVRAQLEF